MSSELLGAITLPSSIWQSLTAKSTGGMIPREFGTLAIEVVIPPEKLINNLSLTYLNGQKI